MVTLVLMRHAKSDWNDPSLHDHDRPLNKRGRRDAPMMAVRLAETGFHPEKILSSTAVRARKTAEALSVVLDMDITLISELYGASAGTLLSQAGSSGARTVVVVAHDPGISSLAAELSRGEIIHLPTAAVATFMWETEDWAVTTEEKPTSWSFDTPR